MKKEKKRIILDASFLINLLNSKLSAHENAVGFYREFLNRKSEFLLSAINMAEYLVKGDIDDLPLRNIRLIDYAIEDALITADLHRKIGVKNRYPREVAKDDLKVIAQAVNYNCSVILTADSDFEKYIREVDFEIEIINISKTNYTEYFNN